MLIIRRGIALIALLLLPVFTSTASVSTENLRLFTQQITAFLSQQDRAEAGRDITRNVTILTPSEKLGPYCQGGIVLPAGGTSLSGPQNVLLQCGSKRQFIRIQVEAKARYWVATRIIAPKQIIGINDIRPVEGSLAHLPRDLIFARVPVAGAVATRMIKRNQPLAKSQLRKPWKVLTGNSVNVITPGRGFLIKATGKALNNAATGQHLRVRMKSGRILTGNVLASGEVVVNSASGL